MIKFCGLALVALTAALVLKGQKSDFSRLVSVAASVILLIAAVNEYAPTVSFIINRINGTGFEKYLETLIKALGITLAVQFTSEICRDAGEGALASKLELVGKAELLVLCLPLIDELLRLAADFMS